jgi:hypothetical protein
VRQARAKARRGACAADNEPEVTPPTDPPVTPPSVQVTGHGESCGNGETCKPPARCINVVGMRPNSARKECWITCGNTKCPAGMECTMIYDGPGKVCMKRTQ